MTINYICDMEKQEINHAKVAALYLQSANYMYSTGFFTPSEYNVYHKRIMRYMDANKVDIQSVNNELKELA